jgi:uncharacterized membrane protein YgcG
LLLSQGLASFNRILTFLNNLWIKNDAEARLAITKDSEEEYERYSLAFQGYDNFYDYQVTRADLIHFGFAEWELEELFIDVALLNEKLFNESDARVKTYINHLRAERTRTYIEHNAYYRTFLGFPSVESEYIRVTNDDAGDGSEIFLHEVNQTKYPITYNRIFRHGVIDQIKADHSYEYLKFIESPLSAFFVHNATQFQILRYDESILEESELDNFFTVYEEVRAQLLEIDYIESMERSYYEYTLIMLSFLLYGTFTRYNNKMVDRYTLRDYTKDEIYTILDSNGLDKIKHLSLPLLRRVVQKLPSLKLNKGANKIIDVIFDIVADKSIVIKQYYLEKRFGIDSEGNLELDSTKDYKDQISFVFTEKTLKAGEAAFVGINEEVAYHDMDQGDDSWGGTAFIEDDDVKYGIKELLRKRLLAKDFTSVSTKYLSISKIINVYDKVISSQHLLGLFFQINDARGNYLRGKTIIFEGIEVTITELFAAWFWLYGMANRLSNPEYIIRNTNIINDILVLRHVTDIPSAVKELGSTQILELGSLYTRTVGDFLTEEEIAKYLVSFDYDSSTKVSDILKQYDKNAKIIDAINAKLSKSSLYYEEYRLWLTILNANIIATYTYDLFDGASHYDEYIASHNPRFLAIVENVIQAYSSVNQEVLSAFLLEIKNAVQGFLSSETEGTVTYIVNEDDIIVEENLNDVVTLLNEFMSLLLQVHKIDFNKIYDPNSPGNDNNDSESGGSGTSGGGTGGEGGSGSSGGGSGSGNIGTGNGDNVLRFYYLLFTMHLEEDAEERIELFERLVSDHLSSEGKEFLRFVYEYEDLLESDGEEWLSLIYESLDDFVESDADGQLLLWEDLVDDDVLTRYDEENRDSLRYVLVSDVVEKDEDA